MRIITLNLVSDTDIPRARQVGLALCRDLGFKTFAQTRIVTTLLELGRNAIAHGGGGRMVLALEPEGDRIALQATVIDEGPGIADAAGPSQSGALPGLGLGLSGAERIADRFAIQSDANGTRVTAGFVTEHPSEAVAELAASLAETLTRLERVDPAAALLQQNRDLMQALNERDLLLREVHHRTRNNLSLIAGLVRLSARGAEAEETRRVLTDLELRITAVLGVHEQLERNDEGDRLRLLPFLRGIADRTQSAFGSESTRIEITVGGNDVQVGPRLAVDMGLVVGELLTNALKHAFKDRDAGRITVAVTEEAAAQRLVLVVEDDGPGLPPGSARPSRATSLGWRLIESMASRYGGDIDVSSENGLRVAMTFELRD